MGLLVRILMLNYEFPPIGGGSGNATAHLLHALAKYPDLKIDLVTAGITARVEWQTIHPSVRIAFLPVKKADLHYWSATEIGAWSTKALPFARKLAVGGSYDLCHCWSGWPSGFIGRRIRQHQPYIVALRGSDVPGYSARLWLLDRLVFRRLSRQIWSGAAAVTSVSRQLLSLAHATLPGLAAKVIYNGVDCEQFRPADKATGPFTLLFVGRLIQRKGLESLVGGFSRLLAESPGCRLIIVGGGPERAGLEALIEKLGLEDQTSVVGTVPHDQLPSIYRHASVFVMPSIKEAMPNAMLEAMASGLPSIVTKTGASELVEDSGVVLDESGPLPVYQAAARYLDDPDLRARHGSNARSLAEAMSWDSTAAAYVELYRQATDRTTVLESTEV